MRTSTIREVDFRFVVRSEDDWHVPEKMQMELAKKYPVKRVILRMRNPTEPGFPVTATIVVYLIKEIAGPTLKQMVKDGYSYLKKLMLQRAKRKKSLSKNRRNARKRPRKG